MIKQTIVAIAMMILLTIAPSLPQEEFVPIRRVAENEDIDLVLAKLHELDIWLKGAWKLKAKHSKASSNLNDAQYELYVKLFATVLEEQKEMFDILFDNQVILQQNQERIFQSLKEKKTLATKELFGEDKARVAENGSYYGQISNATGRPKTVHVKGYYRKDGTYVRGHYRSKKK